MSTYSYQAHAKNYGNVTRNTPRQAAQDFFDKHPKARKCNVTEGVEDGIFFTVTYGRASEGQWPQSWKDVTKKTVDMLPTEARERV